MIVTPQAGSLALRTQPPSVVVTLLLRVEYATPLFTPVEAALVEVHSRGPPA